MSEATGSVAPMSSTIYYVASSIDGFIADREGRLDWLLEFGMEEFSPHYESFLENVGVVVMGSTTYEFVLGEGLEAWPYDGRQTRVLTHRDLPVAVEGADIRFESGDVVDLHKEWVEAAAGRDVWIVGGGAIAATLADAGLLDVLDLTIMPVALGAGAALLPLATTRALSVEATTTYPSGALGVTYRLT